MAQLKNNLENIEDRLNSMELRLSNLEYDLARIRSSGNTEFAEENLIMDSSSGIDDIADDEKGFESRIGRIGLAWLGNIVLLFAVLFFTEYLLNRELRVLSFSIGFIAAAGLYLFSVLLKRSNSNLSLMIRINSQIILFYETMRLNFFAENPLISDKYTVFVLLLFVVGLQIFLAIRSNSLTFGFLAIILMLGTSLLVGSHHITLSLFLLASVTAVYFFIKFQWNSILIPTLILVYIANLIWLFGNPVMGNSMEMLPAINYGHLYLFAIGACFSVPPLFRKKDGSTNDVLTGVIILNGMFFTLAIALMSKKYFSTSYVNLFSIITICCLVYSILLKNVDDWSFSSAFYALYGFLAMSISMYGIAGMPDVYLLLSVQSLIVVSMALWFRNRLIIVMNSILFLLILIIYMVSTKSVNEVNLSFAIVPIVSARIINWQKARLDIKTNLIRNLYLIEGFFMVLYALYHVMPKQFITLSWTAAALCYFLLSLLLKNVKYRYMALGTMICAALNLLINDMSGIEIIYRVLALLFLAMVSIGISIYYTKIIRKTLN